VKKDLYFWMLLAYLSTVPVFNNWNFWTGQSSVYLQTDDCGKPRNFYDFSAVSRVIFPAGLQNLAKLSAENCGPYLWVFWSQLLWLHAELQPFVCSCCCWFGNCCSCLFGL